MKLTIERDAALKALTAVLGVVAKRSDFAILTHILLIAEGDELVIIGSGGGMEARTRFDCRIEQGGTTTMDGQRLLDILRGLPSGADLDLSEGDKTGFADTKPIKVKAGRSRFNMPTLPPADFPLLPAEDYVCALTFKASDLALLMEDTRFAIDDSTVRHLLKGVHITPTDSGVRFESASTAGVAQRWFEHSGAVGAWPATIIPSSALGEVERLIKAADDEDFIIVTRHLGRVVFAHGDTVLGVPILGGDYPPLANFIPADFVTKITADVEILQAALKRALIMADGSKQRVKLVTEMGALRLTGQDQDAGLSEDEVDIETEGPNVELRVAGAQLLGILDHIRTESVIIGVNSDRTPILIKETGEPQSLFIIMPVV